MQIKRGQNAVQILSGTEHAPDAVSPRHSTEPQSNVQDGAKTTSELDLAPIKDKSIETVASVIPKPGSPQTAPLIWGRWTSVLSQGSEVDISSLTQSYQLIGTNNYYALMRSREETWQKPEQSSLAFSLRGYQATVLNQQTQIAHSAGIENGSLSLDFSKSSFSTQFDLISQSERYRLVSQGQITSDGKLSGNNQFASPTNMAVKGVINADNASAAYLFQSRITPNQIASGITYWSR